MAYLRVTFKGAPEMAQGATGAGGGPTGVCPQPRKTAKAPQEFLAKTNQLPASEATVQAGKALFLQNAQPVACAMCHGDKGNGQGIMGAALIPPPRNFTCGSVMKDLPDGQLFWIIKNGSPGTGMMSFAGLPDDQVWQLIAYVRSLAK
jgi:mono/diheme cytochrome c family protein